MCCCGKPTINGEPGAYSWDGKHFMTSPVNPPELSASDELIYDEPGRCGGLDCHSHHFRLVKRGYYIVVLARHGGGTESVDLGATGKLMLPSLASMDTNARYWLLHTLYSAARDEAESVREATNTTWRRAAAEGRIKTRKIRNRGAVRVWIEDPPRVEVQEQAA